MAACCVLLQHFQGKGRGAAPWLLKVSPHFHSNDVQEGLQLLCLMPSCWSTAHRSHSLVCSLLAEFRPNLCYNFQPSPEVAKALLPGKSLPLVLKLMFWTVRTYFPPHCLFPSKLQPTHPICFLRQPSSRKLSFGGKFLQLASNIITFEPPPRAARLLWHALPQTMACCLPRALINILSFTSKKEREQHKEPCISQNGALQKNSLKNSIQQT